jgi:hypothetical protein
MSLTSPRRHALLVLAFAGALSSAAFADTFRVVHSVEGSVTSLSADGRTAAGLTMDTFEAFRWTAREGRVVLGRGTWAALGHRSGTPRVSADGKTIGATILSDSGTYSTAGRWTSAGGWQMLAPPLPPGGGLFDGEDSSVFGMSGDGSVLTGLFWRPDATDGSAHGMAWSAATAMRDMGSSGRSSRIDAASADGSVMVGWDEHPQYGNRRAAVWVNGVLDVLEDSDWPSEASAVNGAGTIVVGYSGNPQDYQSYATMWSWNGGGWTKTLLGVITKRGATGFAFATGVNADGSMVVGGARPDVMASKSVGFIWTPQDGLVDAGDWLKAHGAALNPLNPIYEMSAISADGSTLAAATSKVVAPWTPGTVLIRRRTP